ncbi:hypothetical protein J4437_02365 [Candidatus Woesearchaeota archaeon]|nr:hypothetical protein [Candidatus Woesearchaeota archaeon]
MLTPSEIDSWDKLIEQSRDLDLARKFYPKAGKPERVREVFSSAVKHLATYDSLLQEKFDQGAYRPELSNDEVKQIAADSISVDIQEGYLGEIFNKLGYSVYDQAQFSEDQLSSLVNKALREGAQGYHPGEDIREFANGLIEFPTGTEMDEEVSFAYAVFDNPKYQRFVEPELARNVVTLKIFNDLLLGKFNKASKIRGKYPQHYDSALARQLVEDLIDHEAFTEENYSLEYLVDTQRSICKDMFPEEIDKIVTQRTKEFDVWEMQHGAKHPPEKVKDSRERYLVGYNRLSLAKDIADYLDEKREIAVTPEMDKVVSTFENLYLKQQYAQKRGLPYEKTKVQLEIDELQEAFNEAEDRFRILGGIRALEEILGDQKFVEEVGKEKIRQILNERIARAIQDGKAHVVYVLRFGTNLGNGNIQSGVQHFDEYLDVDKNSLLEPMISAIDLDPEHILSNSYDLRSDSLRFRRGFEVDNAYGLYQTIQQEGGRLPSTEAIKKLVFLKMAMHVHDHYEGRGMKVVADVFENPANSEFVDQGQIKRLLTKLFTDYWVNGRAEGFGIISAESVPYFYKLVNSKLGELVKDDQRLAPYFKLHNFLENSNP